MSVISFPLESPDEHTAILAVGAAGATILVHQLV